MAKKSDIRRSTRRVSATEASRSFSAILDEVESGRLLFVHRRGREVCVIAPPPVAPRRASECLALLRGRAPVTLDDRFGDDLRDIIAGERPEDQTPWDS
jgi:antitoxin (DNA-binding transcriptional repressor) of toxin-antitoxin stability system